MGFLGRHACSASLHDHHGRLSKIRWLDKVRQLLRLPPFDGTITHREGLRYTVINSLHESLLTTHQEAIMNTVQEISAGKEETKKRFWSKFMNFLMYGGFLLVIALGLVIVILLDLYVF